MISIYAYAQSAQVVQLVTKANPADGWTTTMRQSSMFSYLLSSLLPIVLLVALWWLLMRNMGNGGMFGMGGRKNSGKLLEGQTPDTKFADVAGEDAAVQEVEEIRDFLKEISVRALCMPSISGVEAKR